VVLKIAAPATWRATQPLPVPCDRLVVVLIRPTRYDDEGYVVRHWRGTLPSNTLIGGHTPTGIGLTD